MACDSPLYGSCSKGDAFDSVSVDLLHAVDSQKVAQSDFAARGREPSSMRGG